MSKESRIAFRTSESLKNRLGTAAKRVGLNETQLAEASVEALVDYIEHHGTITFPLEIAPKVSLAEKRARLQLEEAGAQALMMKRKR